MFYNLIKDGYRVPKFLLFYSYSPRPLGDCFLSCFFCKKDFIFIKNRFLTNDELIELQNHIILCHTIKLKNGYQFREIHASNGQLKTTPDNTTRVAITETDKAARLSGNVKAVSAGIEEDARSQGVSP